jgi:hypothetical protein
MFPLQHNLLVQCSHLPWGREKERTWKKSIAFRHVWVQGKKKSLDPKWQLPRGKPSTQSKKINERREKEKESKYIPKKISKKKKLTPKKQGQTNNKTKEKENLQLPWGRWYNIACTTFLR